MGMSPYIARLRAAVGHDLLLLPSVTVLVRDDAGRLLLVRSADEGAWMTIGGAVDPGESPRDAAVREAREEAGIDVELTGLLDVLGGEGYEITYPGGDRTAYVTAVFEARVTGGTLEADGNETTDVAWFDADALPGLDVVPFTARTLAALGLT